MKYECIFAEDKNIGTVLLPTVWVRYRYSVGELDLWVSHSKP